MNDEEEGRDVTPLFRGVLASLGRIDALLANHLGGDDVRWLARVELARVRGVLQGILGDEDDEDEDDEEALS